MSETLLLALHCWLCIVGSAVGSAVGLPGWIIAASFITYSTRLFHDNKSMFHLSFITGFVFVMSSTLSASTAYPLSLSLAVMAVGREDRDVAGMRQAWEREAMIPLQKLIALISAKAPYHGMTYLGGPQYFPETMRYGLKFLDRNRVVIVYVDARTGQIIGFRR